MFSQTLLWIVFLSLLYGSTGFSRYTFGRATTASATKLASWKLDTNPDRVTQLTTSPLTAGLASFPLVLAATAPLFTSTAAHAATVQETAVSVATSAWSADPLLEAEVLTDMAHLALDFATLFGPSRLVIRAAAVAGRLAAMGADYLPDQRMLPEELVFQVFMLCIAVTALVRSAMPIILSSLASNISVRDGKAFSVLFGPSGMTWPQYKALSVTALDWVTVEPGCIITSDEDSGAEDDYIYWLYSGQAILQSQGKVFHNVTRTGGPALKHGDVGVGLMGETRLLRRMHEKERRSFFTKKPAETGSASASSSTTTKQHPRSTAKAGESGATLLRIHTSNLSMLMDNDLELAQAVRSLLFQGMQDKLAAQMHG
jgi:hypothetical protein